MKCICGKNKSINQGLEAAQLFRVHTYRSCKEPKFNCQQPNMDPDHAAKQLDKLLVPAPGMEEHLTTVQSPTGRTVLEIPCFLSMRDHTQTSMWTEEEKKT